MSVETFIAGARAALPSAVAEYSETTDCDGIVCFGGVDWWYHNRGHYDLQMMRELSATTPVLYINSIGMRVPTTGRRTQFLARVMRKVHSLSRGRAQVRRQMTVYSPLALPGGLGRGFGRRALAWQVRMAARQLGIRRPLVWIACPPAAEVLDAMNPAAVIYQRTDRFEEYPGVDRSRILAYDRALKARADITLFCSSLLLKEESAACRCAVFVDHGVDFEAFSQAGELACPVPALASIPSPRIGYVGNLEPHRVDHGLLADVARALPDMHFVVVGPGLLHAGLASLSNVHAFSQQLYEEVPRFMAACDALIMPWNENPWINACNPVKLKEYLATGRPVVTTPFYELGRYSGVVHIARGADEFAAAIRQVIRYPDDPERLRTRVQQETWTAKAETVLARLRALGIRTGRTSPRVAAAPCSVTARLVRGS